MTQHKLSSRELARGLVTDRFKSIPINRAYAIINFQCGLIKCNNCITTQESLEDNKGLSCIFPFIVEGKTYNKCTSDFDPEGKLWCATETDGSGKIVTNKWGYCSDDNACLER